MSRSVIIGVLAALLALASGCSALRLGYSQAPEFAYWWLDSYVDIDEAQSQPARDAIQAWFRWHRATQLPDYAALLARTQSELSGPVTPAQVCRLLGDIAARSLAAIEQAAPAMAEIARTLTPRQIAHVQRKHVKNNAKYRDDYLQDSPEERLDAAVRRVVDRAETLYGRLDEAQRERIVQLMAASPFDPQAWFAERRLRQQEVLQTLRRLSSEPVPPDEAQAAIRRWVEHSLRSPREPYRAYQQRLAQYNCAFAAQVHNMTTVEQKRRAVAKLKDWEEDLRALAAEGRPQ